MRDFIRNSGLFRVATGPLICVLLILARMGFCQVAPPAPLVLPAPLTLPEAIRLALRQQPQLYLARTQVTQAEGQRLQAQSQYFPTLTPSYQYQNNSQTLYGVTTGGPAGAPNTANQISTVRGGGLSLGLSQTLFDTGQREAVNTEARRAVDAAGYSAQNTQQTIILTVTEDYYQLLLNRDLVKVATAQAARFQQAVDVTQAQIDAGTTAAKDIYQAKADLANAQVTLLNSRNSVQTSSAALKNALGINLAGTLEIAPLTTGNQLPPVPTGGQAQTLPEALAAAFAARPDVRGQQAVVQSDAAALRLAQREAGLSVKGNYVLGYQATNDVGLRGVSSQFVVSGSYPLFDAGLARGAVRIAQASRDGALDQLELVRQQVRLEVEQAYSTRQANLEAAGLAQAAVTAAQVNYDAAIASRKEGIGTVLDITTAQATLTQAQSQYVTAVYNYYIADAQLQRAIGRNDEGLPPTR